MFLVVVNIGDADPFPITLDSGYGTGKDPWMPANDGRFSTLFEDYVWHDAGSLVKSVISFRLDNKSRPIKAQALMCFGSSSRSKFGLPLWSDAYSSLIKVPLLPPLFLTSRMSPMDIPLSTALHMS